MLAGLSRAMRCHEMPAAMIKPWLWLCLLLASVPAAATTLAHTKWVEADQPECPDAIYFGVRRYLFLNACRAIRRDGVVERGNYAREGDVITLSERRATGPSGIRGVPPAIGKLHIVTHTPARLAIRAGETLLEFRSGTAVGLQQAARQLKR